MKPVKAWAVVDKYGQLEVVPSFEFPPLFQSRLDATDHYSPARGESLVRVEITEVPKKAKVRK